MNDNDPASNAVEDENIEGATSESNSAEASVAVNGTDAAASFLSLEELIKNQIDSIAKLKEELKAQREMFEDSFSNSPAYHEHTEKVKEATKAKLSVKKQISAQPSVALLSQKIKDLRVDLSDKNKTLSDLVFDYREKTGATQIETRDGQVLEIVSTMKLVRRNSK